MRRRSGSELAPAHSHRHTAQGNAQSSHAHGMHLRTPAVLPSRARRSADLCEFDAEWAGPPAPWPVASGLARSLSSRVVRKSFSEMGVCLVGHGLQSRVETRSGHGRIEGYLGIGSCAPRLNGLDERVVFFEMRCDQAANFRNRHLTHQTMDRAPQSTVLVPRRRSRKRSGESTKLPVSAHFV